MPNRYGYFFPALLLLTGLAVVMPNVARSQSIAGDKTVWGLNPNNQVVTTPSQAWIDASAFWVTGNAPDICLILRGILTDAYAAAYPNGAVIDARGLYLNQSGAPPSQIMCNTGTPFDSLIGPPPTTTILLPASTIPISATWILPNNTKIVGQGPTTVISATPSLQGPYMIEMGSANLCPAAGCKSVGIEDLLLNPNANSTGGIRNQWAQDSSYVDHVNLYMFSGTGIDIEAPGSNSSSPGATNSGPYSNIAVGTGSVCIKVETQTRGIHGVTCTGNSTTQNTPGVAAIYVDAGNNSIEDIQIEYFWDGIEVGNVVAPAVVGNLVFSNILGSHMHNVVHICGPHPYGSTFGSGNIFGECSINNASNGAVVSDVTILQAENYNYFQNGIVTATSVLDDTTGTSIEGCSNSVCGINLSTALYVLGEPTGGITGAYSRFTASPAYPSTNGNYGDNSAYVPTWGVGNSSIGNSACFTPGALYSNTAGTSFSAVYVCTYTGTPPFSWKPIA